MDDTQNQEDDTTLNLNYGINDNEENYAVISSLHTREEPVGAIEHDLGTSRTMMKDERNELQSSEEETNYSFKVPETTQTTRTGMDCAPPWILHNALQHGISNNWKYPRIKRREKDIEKHVTVISSHVDNQIKFKK